MSILVAEVDEQDVSTNITKWRAAARFYARQAQQRYLDESINEGDDVDELVARRVDVAALAGLSAMYFALAADAELFGPLPPEDAANGD